MAFTWTGIYAGGHAGISTGDTQGQVPGGGPLLSADYSIDGGIYGGHIGYNYQLNNVVVGIEGTYTGTDVEGSTTRLFVLSCSRDIDWIATIEARLGYAMGPAMVYARGGVAWADMSTDVSIVGISLLGGSDTHVGWTAGFGFEYALSSFVIARVEYSHYDFDTEQHLLGGVIPDDVEASLDAVKVGVSFKLN